MRLFYDRSVAIVLLALAAVLIARGIVPAVSKIDSDFPGYFTAAKIVADGGPVERLGILGILTLLEAPATATYHFVLRETPTLGLSPS